jgi:hypothetical protein
LKYHCTPLATWPEDVCRALPVTKMRSARGAAAARFARPEPVRPQVIMTSVPLQRAMTPEGVWLGLPSMVSW